MIVLDVSDIGSLKIELNSLLAEVGSIHSDCFAIETINDRLQILHSLTGDLFAARINYVRNMNNDIFSSELNPRKDLNIINNCLSIVDNLKDIKTYFEKIHAKLMKNISKLNEEDSLLLPENKSLTSNQWAELKKLNEIFQNEYSIRRDMLLRRAYTTVNSFCWKEDKTRSVDEKQIKEIFNNARKKIPNIPCITLSHALAARSSDCASLINEVISTTHANCIIEVPTFGKANQGAQQRLQLHKFLIGSVPDRGGRPTEQPAPPKETFTQQRQQRESYANRGRGGKRHDNYRDSRTSDYHQQKYVPEHSNKIQNAGWQQQGGGGYSNNYRANQSNRMNNQYDDDYSQYESGYQRNSGYNNYRGNTNRGYDNRGRSRGQYRQNRY